ncbi:hypothetical protein Mterra_04112 [Calidithermus terrae]|uniref:Uncharacterized protein n=1 Tax=Calidithermus terrae TaxID=1408545 RepID=A0A399DQ98_9DEIN|nr:hypothetical protein Mterra_04112 [Calidithermus terrae]
MWNGPPLAPPTAEPTPPNHSTATRPLTSTKKHPPWHGYGFGRCHSSVIWRLARLGDTLGLLKEARTHAGGKRSTPPGIPDRQPAGTEAVPGAQGPARRRSRQRPPPARGGLRRRYLGLDARGSHRAHRAHRPEHPRRRQGLRGGARGQEQDGPGGGGAAEPPQQPPAPALRPPGPRQVRRRRPRGAALHPGEREGAPGLGRRAPDAVLRRHPHGRGDAGGHAPARERVRQPPPDPPHRRQHLRRGARAPRPRALPPASSPASPAAPSPPRG